MTPATPSLHSAFARVGILFGAEASRETPDLERLLLDVARQAPGDARLFGAAVAWLAAFGNLVAKHRLKRLAQDELETGARPVLGFLLDLATGHGAPKALLAAVKPSCRKAAEPGPLFRAYLAPTLAPLAEQQACRAAKRWNLWAPDFPPRGDILRPSAWPVAHNAGFRERAAHKGDLRTSILETLRRDTPEGRVASESELARLCAANRPALRAALVDLEVEGLVVREEGRSRREGRGVRLVEAGE